MKIAVLSDVHGFSPALSSVLEDIRSKGVDQIIAAGDICVGGPDPAGSIHLLREHDCSAVYGNTDLNLLGTRGTDDDETAWTRRQLSDGDMEWLRGLPFSVRIPHPDQGVAGDPSELLIVHANPSDVDRHLSPNASDRELLEIIGHESAQTIAFGHLHVAYTRQLGQYTLVDVSAVGNPKDSDLRTRYVIFEASSEAVRWSHAFHFLQYPLEETQAMMESSGMPNWAKAWKRLNKAEYGRPV